MVKGQVKGLLTGFSSFLGMSTFNFTWAQACGTYPTDHVSIPPTAAVNHTVTLGRRWPSAPPGASFAVHPLSSAQRKWVKQKGKHVFVDAQSEICITCAVNWNKSHQSPTGYSFQYEEKCPHALVIDTAGCKGNHSRGFQDDSCSGK